VVQCSRCHNLFIRFASAYLTATDHRLQYTHHPNAPQGQIGTTVNKRTTARFDSVRTTAIGNFIGLLSRATTADLAAARAWYADAGAFADSLRVSTGWNMEVACSVVSAFSPRVTWAHNKAKALQYAQGITPKGLRSHVDAADRCVREGFKGLKGPKTNAFARAIAGDSDAVVVDVWMCRAAGLLKADGTVKDAPTVVEYRAIADAIRSIAATPTVSMSPATLQALLWIVIRGKAD